MSDDNKVRDDLDAFQKLAVAAKLQADSPPINEFQIWVVQTCENGAGAHPGSCALIVSVQDGKLVLGSEQSDVVDPNCEPIANVIRRKLMPKSGNHLFVS